MARRCSSQAISGAIQSPWGPLPASRSSPPFLMRYRASYQAIAHASGSMRMGNAMNDDAVRDLALRAGIAIEWQDVSGKLHVVAPGVLRRVLAALGLPSGNRGDAVASRRLLAQRASASTLPPLITATAGRPTRLEVGGNEPQPAFLVLE